MFYHFVMGHKQAMINSSEACLESIMRTQKHQVALTGIPQVFGMLVQCSTNN
jgi:hypothetical protein